MEKSGKARVAFFAQHHIEHLDLSLSSVEQLAKLFPGSTAEQYRQHLGSFGISGPLSLRPIYLLSGGQKSRVALSVVTWNKPHILIFDEPTNHLDLDAVNALILSLNTFSGGI